MATFTSDDDDNMIVLNSKDELHQSILSAAGVPQDLLQPTITLTREQNILLLDCAYKPIVSRFYKLLCNKDVPKTIFQHKQWLDLTTDRYLLCGFYQPRVIEMMLYVAIDFENDEIAEILLLAMRKFEITIPAVFQAGLLAVACQRGSSYMLKLLLNAWPISNDTSTLALETFISNLDIGTVLDTEVAQTLEHLIYAGADINTSRLPNRHTHGHLLHLAIFRRSPTTMIFLLTHGAILPQSGALQAAASINSIEGLNILLTHGADVNEILHERVRSTSDKQILSNSNECALAYAVRCGCVEAVSWLLEKGADPRLFRETSSMELDAEGNEEKLRAAEMIWEVAEELETRNGMGAKRKDWRLMDSWDDVRVKKAGMSGGGYLARKSVIDAEKVSEEWPKKFQFDIATEGAAQEGFVPGDDGDFEEDDFGF